MNKQDLKEKAIFLSVSLGIFLPVRFFFYTFVSTYWFGSFGVITLLMIFLLYLVKKERLGYFGRIWKKQIIKISKGKLGIFGMAQSLFFILLLSSVVIVTDYFQNTPTTDLIKEELSKSGIDDLESLISAYPDQDYYKLLLPETWVEMFFIIQENPEMFAGIYSVIDDWSLGFHQHFMIVFLVEEFEVFGFIIYFRYFYKVKEKTKGVKCS